MIKIIYNGGGGGITIIILQTNHFTQHPEESGV